MWTHLLLILIISLNSVQLTARERIALVIGNANYHVSPLLTATNDAQDVAAALRQSGFRVILKLDADQQTMESAIHQFAQSLHPNSEALFYYAGHGAQAKYGERENYLIPVGAIPDIQRATHLRYKAVPASLVLREMQYAGSPLNIIILDACRNSPFRGINRSLGRGLARMPSADGTLVAYSTAPNQVALDKLEQGERNSPYTTQLLKFIQQPGLTLEQVLKNTRREVKRITNDEQTPWYESSLDGYFYFSRNASENASENVFGNVSGSVNTSISLSTSPQIDSAATGGAGVELGFDTPRNYRETAAGLNLDMVWIKGDCFTIGSPESEDGHQSDEAQKRVCVHNNDGYWMGKTEITQAQWQAIMGDNPSYFKGANRPVERVSWNDTQDFLNKLKQRTGKDYRLPTEAEWEYAARAGSNGAYGQGQGERITENNLNRYAWFRDNSDKKTHPVGSKRANAYGLHDMHGNVWEWTCSAWSSTYNGEEQQCKNHAESRSLRGGSWSSDASTLRSANRFNFTPDIRNNFIGLRLAREK